MSALLVAMLVTLVAPLALNGWRLRLVALGLQGVLMACMVLEDSLRTPLPILLLVDLFIVRGLGVPLVLQHALGAPRARKPEVPTPPSMWWYLGIACAVAASFAFATRVEPTDGEHQLALAVSTAGLLLGLFQLATQTGVFSQIVGALYIENAIALFELESGASVPLLPIQVGLLIVLIGSILLSASYLQRLPVLDGTSPGPVEEEPAL